MEKRIIFHIENRGYGYIFHWYSYMLAGLRHIPNNKSRFGPDGGGAIEQNYNGELLNLNEPYNLYFSYLSEFEQFQQESLDIISDLFVVVKKEDISDKDIIVNNYGEFISWSPTHISKDAYLYLRDLFLPRAISSDTKYKNKKYYLSRSKSHLLSGNSGLKRRQIINESEFDEYLKSKNIEKIFLEDFSTKEKINIFNQADLIISPNSGGLLFSLFTPNTSKIIELNVSNPHQISEQYKNQCDALNIPYYKFTTEKIDNMDNMKIDINTFNSFLNTIKCCPNGIITGVKSFVAEDIKED